MPTAVLFSELRQDILYFQIILVCISSVGGYSSYCACLKHAKIYQQYSLPCYIWINNVYFNHLVSMFISCFSVTAFFCHNWVKPIG